MSCIAWHFHGQYYEVASDRAYERDSNGSARAPLYPTARGFSFIVFEGPESPYDWGVKKFTGQHKNQRCIDAIKKLIDQYQPYAVILEDTYDTDIHRASRIKKLYFRIAHLAQSERIEVHRFTRAKVKNTFRRSGASTKYEIAQAVAIHIPAFAHRLPPLRKPWMSEDPRMSLFDAAALGLTFFATRPERGDLPGA